MSVRALPGLALHNRPGTLWSQGDGRAEKEKKKMQRHTYLDSSLEGQVCVARVAHLEDAAKPILGQVANLEDLQVGGHGAEVELADEDVVDDDRGLGRLIEGLGQEVARLGVELCVGRERRPVEVEGHV